MQKLNFSNHQIATQIQWYLLKLPLTVVLIMVGFFFEAITSWPFALLCSIHPRPRQR